MSAQCVSAFVMSTRGACEGVTTRDHDSCQPHNRSAWTRTLTTSPGLILMKTGWGFDSKNILTLYLGYAVARTLVFSSPSKNVGGTSLWSLTMQNHWSCNVHDDKWVAAHPAKGNSFSGPVLQYGGSPWYHEKREVLHSIGALLDQTSSEREGWENTKILFSARSSTLKRLTTFFKI